MLKSWCFISPDSYNKCCVPCWSASFQLLLAVEDTEKKRKLIRENLRENLTTKHWTKENKQAILCPTVAKPKCKTKHSGLLPLWAVGCHVCLQNVHQNELLRLQNRLLKKKMVGLNIKYFVQVLLSLYKQFLWALTRWIREKIVQDSGNLSVWCTSSFLCMLQPLTPTFEPCLRKQETRFQPPLVPSPFPVLQSTEILRQLNGSVIVQSEGGSRTGSVTKSLQSPPLSCNYPPVTDDEDEVDEGLGGPASQEHPDDQDSETNSSQVSVAHSVQPYQQPNGTLRPPLLPKPTVVSPHASTIHKAQIV